ncbi:MAG: L,D-transpeptidase [Methylobacteriaceae bacterium]|nr:L,D-transpeptidase [Methylobacteriaceae bacterium]
MITRRSLFTILAALPLAACQSTAQQAEPRRNRRMNYAPVSEDSWYIGAIPDDPVDIPTVDWALMPEEFRRQRVLYLGRERPGTIVIDTSQRFLYYVEGGGVATRYGIGVGKEGYAFQGTARVGRKAVWPGWSPTSSMLAVNPSLPQHLPGGVDNPLGARALYLYQGDRDTLFRIHGTNEPWSIGKAVSSGCIRMMNEDVYHLYQRVGVNTPVIVRN